jgi:hypothetical protein
MLERGSEATSTLAGRCSTAAPQHARIVFHERSHEEWTSFSRQSDGQRRSCLQGLIRLATAVESASGIVNLLLLREVMLMDPARLSNRKLARGKMHP